MVILGFLFTGLAMIIVTIATTVIEIMSIVFIIVGAITLRKDKEREIEYEKTVSANEQPVKKYRRKIYPRVLLAIGVSVQAIYLISEIIGLLMGIFS